MSVKCRVTRDKSEPFPGKSRGWDVACSICGPLCWIPVDLDTFSYFTLGTWRKAFDAALAHLSSSHSEGATS